ncbi:MAG: glucose-1-phosphate cytidylyltransferase [Hyphomonadaceae bacterium]|nr:MAG: glucose-1-phosphate cytidylyltransferase [Caulobacteraceae bacterium]MBT9446287.1 glucose-1-phosphate cytidylyltransferase [Hyphomonadaceae bacterium]TPW08876.1 MAG: glucose-1-phosphate cytidylyltransferase [Alphaproteobacteria bacterium]
MKVVLFAGGFGTRLSEETAIRPKPMVDVGPRPILWHIMKIYAAHGLTDFVILGGYKVDFIRNWLFNYRQSVTDFEIDFATGEVKYFPRDAEPWKVTVLDTGLDTMTGGRLKRAREVIGDEAFCLTYGDGVSDVNVTELVDFHRKSGATATVTAVYPPGRFGVLGLTEGDDMVTTFREKDAKDEGLINGGFFVCEPAVFDMIDGDETVWEQEPMNRIVHAGGLAAYRHRGFWQSMDTLRDKAVLDKMWDSGKAPWKIWKD